MSLKTVHFLVFMITSLMSFVCAMISFRNHNQAVAEGTAGGELWLAIGFGVGGLALLIYSFWYLQHSQKKMPDNN